MYFLYLWILTVCASFYMDANMMGNIIKKVADLGYVLDRERMNKLYNLLGENSNMNVILTNMIPIFNIIMACRRTVEYNNNSDMIVCEFNALGALKEMNEKDKEIYLKNPTAETALSITFNSSMQDYLEEQIGLIEVEDKNGVSKIKFDFVETGEILILNVSGPASKLTKKEQIKMVCEEFNRRKPAILTKVKDKNGTSKIISKYVSQYDEDGKLIGMDLVILNVSGPASKLTEEEQKEIVHKELDKFNKKEIEKYERNKEIKKMLTKSYDLDIEQESKYSQKKQELENLRNNLEEEKRILSETNEETVKKLTNELKK